MAKRILRQILESNEALSVTLNDYTPALRKCLNSLPTVDAPAAATPVHHDPTAMNDDTILPKKGWHQADETPPDEFNHGPLTGQRKQLASWIMQDDDPRNLDTKLRIGNFWGRRDKRQLFSVWFKDQKRFAEANSRKLAEEQRDTNKER